MLANRAQVDRQRLLSLIPTDLSPEAAASILTQYVDARPFGYGPDRAVLRERGVSIWVIIASLDAAEGDTRQVVEEYVLRDVDLLAALLYYRTGPNIIEARILLNRAASMAHGGFRAR